MTDQEKIYRYQIQRRNALLNCARFTGNMGMGAVVGNYDEDVRKLGYTTIVFSDGTIETFDWRGTVDFQTMKDSGLVRGTFDPETGLSEDFAWVRDIDEI